MFSLLHITPLNRLRFLGSLCFVFAHHITVNAQTLTTNRLPAALQQIPFSDDQVIDAIDAEKIRARSVGLLGLSNAPSNIIQTVASAPTQVPVDPGASVPSTPLEIFQANANALTTGLVEQRNAIEANSVASLRPGGIRQFGNRFFGPGVSVNLETGTATLFSSAPSASIVQLSGLTDVSDVFRGPDGLVFFDRRQFDPQP